MELILIICLVIPILTIIVATPLILTPPTHPHSRCPLTLPQAYRHHLRLPLLLVGELFVRLPIGPLQRWNKPGKLRSSRRLRRFTLKIAQSCNTSKHSFSDHDSNSFLFDSLLRISEEFLSRSQKWKTFLLYETSKSI